ncbi:MAG: DeoR/GlpR family DNA-binding transcription regulator [Cutibacterium granulosum]|nr:DeoR/GlpR family DNA-binding transcription regulator [Cutibacterium granulosum]
MIKRKSNVPQGPQGRQLAIAQAVIRAGSVSIDELVDFTGVSVMTIYRDLGVLEECGVVQRHRGQVFAVASGLHEADAEFRLEQSSVEKRAVAAKAAELINTGTSIMLDDSTSAVWVLRALADPSSVTVVTNSLLVAREVTERLHSDRLFVTGGEYQAWAHALMGPAAVSSIRSMHAEVCIVSASGISGKGCYHPYREVVEVKRAMIDSAETSVLLLDHTKFDRRALFKFAELREFDHVVVDERTPSTTLQQLAEWGVSVTIAPLPEMPGV